MNDANKPCHCGSGKKFKKCCKDKKPRTKTIEYEFGELKTIDGLNFNTLTGELIAFKEDKKIDFKAAEMEVTYERPKGKKVLTQIPMPLNNPTLNLSAALEPFDLLLAIDTNTQTINEHKLSVSCLIGGYVRKETSESFGEHFIRTPYALNVYEPQVIALWNIKEKEENVGWMTFIEAVMRNPIYKEDSKILVIVDSDLGNIDDYNLRKLPIYGNFYLPQNMQLRYASSDAGSEFFACQMLRLADTEGKILIKEAKELAKLATHDEFLNCLPIEGKAYTHFLKLR
ncbi:MAG: SEC-C domain-containing protein [Acidobacteria bacterium]|jgi:hypothetical protein|nr:SEC-C domain-containing protein [Acidobacteriota bacterium]